MICFRSAFVAGTLALLLISKATAERYVQYYHASAFTRESPLGGDTFVTQLTPLQNIRGRVCRMAMLFLDNDKNADVEMSLVEQLIAPGYHPFRDVLATIKSNGANESVRRKTVKVLPQPFYSPDLNPSTDVFLSVSVSSEEIQFLKAEVTFSDDTDCQN